MSTTEYYHRSVKLQFADITKVRIVIPVRIRRAAEIEPGTNWLMQWRETTGKIIGCPVKEASLTTTAIFPGGREQMYCVFPKLFCRKYQLSKGTCFNWELRDGRIQGSLEVPTSPRRYLRTYKKPPQQKYVSPLHHHNGRLRITIPTVLCDLLNIKPEHFARWTKRGPRLLCRLTHDEYLDTTAVEHRRSGVQVEIPKFFCDHYRLLGQQCTWTFHHHTLTGAIPFAKGKRAAARTSSKQRGNPGTQSETSLPSADIPQSSS